MTLEAPARDGGASDSCSERPGALRPLSFELGNINEVLWSPCGAFVLQECVEPNNPNCSALDFECRGTVDSPVKVDARNARQQIDSERWNSELNDFSFVREISWLNLERLNGGAEGDQTVNDLGGILGARAHQHIDVFGRANIAVVGNGEAAHDHELNPGIGEADQCVTKVSRELHAGSPRFRLRTGHSDRGRSGQGAPLKTQAA